MRNGFSTPEQWGVPRDRRLRGVVWHTMEGYYAGAVDWWNRGNGGAHFCILRSGEIILVCDLENIAWHAGTNNEPNGPIYGRTEFWRRNNANPWTVGVECEGWAEEGISTEQEHACIRLGTWLKQKYGIPSARMDDTFDGHHAHADISALRSDPGPHFPWDRILAGIAAG